MYFSSKKKFVSESLILIIIIISILFSFRISSQFYFEEQKGDSVQAQMSLVDSSILVDHNPIIIDSDSDLDTLGFSGDGNIDNPYIIENLRIVTDDYYSISISSTTKYITIRSCYTESINAGIMIYDTVSSNTILIEDNECRNSAYGIKIRISSTIIQNTCINNVYGISAKNSPTSKIQSNECRDNEVMGITISDSADSEVTDNICSNNQREDGIHIDDSPNTRVENNICIDNGYNGIWIRFSNSSTISHNELTNNGLTIYENSKVDYLSYTFENNRVNDKILGYLESQKDIVLEEPIYGQIFLVDCENIIVKNQEIYDASIGIKVLYSKLITIQENICMENSWYAGIMIEHSNDCRVIDNECWYNEMAGIRITSSLNTTLENNLVVYNNIGISISYSPFSSITDNQLLNNSLTGLSAYEIDSSSFWNNTCFRNNYGIAVAATTECEIKLNFFVSNSLFGLFLRYETYNNTVHHNAFVDNNINEYSQAKDDGEANLWYDVLSEEGNYWSNIGQNYTYMIDGSANSMDPYPLSVSPISVELPTLPIPPVIYTDKTSFQFYPIYVVSILFVIYICMRRKRFQYVD
ncbi:MAG: hypothetical protein GPJ51_05845 [Candidatus Heimdallarchaeota archaeon]|nr:hypothetical protein [Candidatus Heimdallarchaeota archaeon]